MQAAHQNFITADVALMGVGLAGLGIGALAGREGRVMRCGRCQEQYTFAVLGRVGGRPAGWDGAGPGPGPKPETGGRGRTIGWEELGYIAAAHKVVAALRTVGG